MKVNKFIKIKNFLYLMRVNNPIGFFLLLWPNLSSLILAGKKIPSINLIFIFIIGTFLMRSAGCIINDYIDCNIDKEVKRTKTRPLSIGILKKTEALFLFFILILFCFLLLIFNLDKINIYLCITCLVCSIIYPFMKIYFLPQLFLGFTFSLSILISWSSVNSFISINCIIFFLANFFWTIAYDTQYAMIDIKDDIRIGVKSTAILFKNKINIFIFCLQMLTLFFLLVLGINMHLNIFYWIAILFIKFLFIYQQKLILKNKYNNYLKAFLNNHYIGILLFLGSLLNAKNLFIKLI